MSVPALAALAIVLITLVAVLARPRGLSEGTAASLGAVLVLGLGLVSPRAAYDAVAGRADVLLFFVALLLIAWTVEASGFFEWAALLAARSAGGRAERLLLNIFLAGAAITALLSNDATALLLTPTVFVIVRRLRLPAMPFVLACTFIADTASILLPVSNPLNLIVLASFLAPLSEFLARLLLPALAAITINVAVFVVIFRRLRGCRFDADGLPPPGSAIPDARYFRASVAGVLALALGYLAALHLGWPVAIPGLAVAGCLTAAALRWGRIRPREATSITWTIVPFVAAMFVLVQALVQQRVAAEAGDWLVRAGGGDVLRTSLALTFGSALGANLVNNLPMTAFMVEAIAHAPAQSAAAQQASVWGALLGDALGPNLTLLGSLATMLWLVLLRDRGLEIRAWDYVRVGLVVTPPMLLAAALLLALSLMHG